MGAGTVAGAEGLGGAKGRDRVETEAGGVTQEQGRLAEEEGRAAAEAVISTRMKCAR